MHENEQLSAISALQEICFLSNYRGELVAADPDCGGMADSLPLFVEAENGACGCDSETALLAYRHRIITNGRYHHRGARALTGDWRIDAWPRFTEIEHHFTGYCGVMTRLADAVADEDHHDYRQLVHELRTPAGALKGFAEIIETQLFGPVADPYRHLAGEIIADTDVVLEQLSRLK